MKGWAVSGGLCALDCGSGGGDPPLALLPHKKTPHLIPQMFSFYLFLSNVQASFNLLLGKGG